MEMGFSRYLRIPCTSKFLVSCLLIRLFLVPANSVDSTWAAGACGREGGACAPGNCCSKYGFCGSTSDYCQPGNSMETDAVPIGLKLENVMLTRQEYIQKAAGTLSGLYCDKYDEHRPYPACMTNFWVAYSQQLDPPMSMNFCGALLKITNRNPSSGKSITACILDRKANPGLDLESDGFYALDDGERSGYNSGHMMVDLEFVPQN